MPAAADQRFDVGVHGERTRKIAVVSLLDRLDRRDPGFGRRALRGCRSTPTTWRSDGSIPYGLLNLRDYHAARISTPCPTRDGNVMSITDNRSEPAYTAGHAWQ